MAFWSSQRLERELSLLIGHNRLDAVDCNAITMRVGGEVYITPGLEESAPNSHTKQLLPPDGPIAIPAGRFAFLLTEETVAIPKDAMGFISIKATFKSKGLVNVSGFHVDPGWRGPLIFAVFNAGPATIHLQRGMDLFLLWIAELDEPSKKHKSKPGQAGIPPTMINNLSGVVDSVYALEGRIDLKLDALGKKDEGLRDEFLAMRERQTRLLTFFAIAAVFGGALVGALVKGAGDWLFPAKPAISAPASPPIVIVTPSTSAGAAAPSGLAPSPRLPGPAAAKPVGG